MAAPRALPTPPSAALPPPVASPPPAPATPSRPALPIPPAAGSLRKKRNLKALQLPTPPLPSGPGAPLPPLPTRDAPPPLKRGLSIDVQNAQPHNTGLGLFGRGAALGSGLPPISASVLMTPESSTTQRRNLQMALTGALEAMRISKPGGMSSSTSSTLGSGGLASGESGVSTSTATSVSTAASTVDGAAETIILDPLQDSDLRNLAELGMGNGGSVMKVEHVPTGIIMAKKIVLIDAKPSVRKQILRELHIMHACSSPFIVSSFGAFLAEPNICICMEYMNKGSFESIYKSLGGKNSRGDTCPAPIPLGVVRQVAKRVLGGLVYLYEEMGVLHRDIKPSNILLNSQGQVKLCDFGVSGELENSVAKTFVGTSVYMSPERIQGSDYSVKSDVWSLGITLIELAHGCFPFSDTEVDFDEEELDATDRGPGAGIKEMSLNSAALTPASAIPSAHHTRRKSRGVSLHGGVGTLSILELMHHIVREPPPLLISPLVPHSMEFAKPIAAGGAGVGPESAEEARVFVERCLMKNPGERMSPRELLGTSWMKDGGVNQETREGEIDLRTWAEALP